MYLAWINLLTHCSIRTSIFMQNHHFNLKYRVFHAKWNITKRCISASRNAKADLRTVLDSSLTAIFVRINYNFSKENFNLHISCVWTCQKWKKRLFLFARFWHIDLFFAVISKWIELGSWAWSCFKGNFK